MHLDVLEETSHSVVERHRAIEKTFLTFLFLFHSFVCVVFTVFQCRVCVCVCFRFAQCCDVNSRCVSGALIKLSFGFVLGEAYMAYVRSRGGLNSLVKCVLGVL